MSTVLNTLVHSDDDMFCGDPQHYEACGRQFASFVERASLLVGEKSPKILELPCGFGRVTRHLTQNFAPADIVAADAMPNAVQFCKEQFGVSGIVVTEPLNEFRGIPEKAFKVAAMGSLITHLDEAQARTVLTHFLAKLSQGGIAVITTHGSRAKEVLLSDIGWFELLTEDRQVLKEAALQGEYGYVRYAPGHAFEKKTVESVGESYGISLTPHEWMLGVVAEMGFYVVDYIQGGWDNHQDVYFVAKIGDNL